MGFDWKLILDSNINVNRQSTNAIRIAHSHWLENVTREKQREREQKIAGRCAF